MNRTSIAWRSTSEEETLRLGRVLGSCLIPGMTVLLSGDLGTGKTVFVRGVGQELGVMRVRSPSFTLVNEYRTKNFSLVHVDLYRLDSESVDDLEIQDYIDLDSVLFVEWPERWKTPPESSVLKIKIEAEDETTRTFTVVSCGAEADLVLDAWHAKWKANEGR